MKKLFLLLPLLTYGFLHAQGFNQISSGLERLSNFAVADYNNDGLDDVFGYQFFFGGPANVALWLNAGNTPFPFAAAELGFDLEVVGQPVATDFDGDGDTDIAVARAGDTPSDRQIVFLLNDSAANFTIDDSRNLPSGDLLQAADLNEDGTPDLVSLDTDENTITYYGSNNDNWTAEVLLEDAADLEFIQLADIDNDGDVDILPGYDGGVIRVGLFQNAGNGTFDDIALITSGQFIRDMVVGDINGDDLPDIYTAYPFNLDLRVYVNQRGLNFELVTLGTSPGSISSILPVDLNGDGAEDIVVGAGNANIVWFENLDTSDPVSVERFDLGEVTSAFSTATIDLENDGDIDILASNNDFWVYENILPQAPSNTLNFDRPAPNVYPNPVDHEISFDQLPAGNYQVIITDLSGKTILSDNVVNGTIKVANLARGSYLLQLLTSDGTTYQPIMINKM
ncbi:MAG: FG-GAP-like repeat-containing protein [Bacteroidota bacterium]